MKKIVLVFVFLGASFLSNAQTINPNESKVEFEIGNMGIGSVDGTINGMKGLVNFNKADLSNSSFDVTIDPNSIDTENKKRDKHLKEEDFFFVEKYLTVHFKSTSISKTSSGYMAKGDLTLHGITKSIELPFTINENGNKTTFEGEIEVNRFDYNLGSEAYGGTFMVGETAEVKITCVVEN